MKAATYFKYGKPNVVQISEVSKPSPQKNEILVRVYCSTVNRTDCGFRSSEYIITRIFSGILNPKNPILGCEFSGVVEQIGEQVKKFKIGDRIFGFTDLKFGCHAEYVLVKEVDAVAHLPESISFEIGAALTESSHYAWCDIQAASVQSGQRVLVNGATGGIGSSAVQLCKELGCTVTAVCDTKNIELIRSLGADSIIDYLHEDFTLLTDKFDLVFDAVGKSSFGKCKKILKENGLYISTELGPYWQNPFLALWTKFSNGQKVLFPIPKINVEYVEFIKKLTLEGKYRPLIDRYYDLSQIVKAYEYVETGMKTGNVIIRIHQ